jgi:tryptophan halogenase
LQKANSPISIALVEIASDVTKHDSCVVPPSHKTIHDSLGANEDHILTLSNSTKYYAQRYSRWSGNTNDFFVAFDKMGTLKNPYLLQFWLSAKKFGLDIPLENFSPGCLAAKSGVCATNGGNAFYGPLEHGYHIDSSSYLKVLKSQALALGVDHYEVAVKNINFVDKNIASVVLVDGTTVEGDLFIDASGDESVLIDQLISNNQIDWSSWLPCDRWISSSTSKLRNIPSFSQVTAFDGGWFSLVPLRDRTGINIYYSSAVTNKANALKSFEKLSDVKFTDGIERARCFGRKKYPWINNCVAVGNAAAKLDSIGAIDLQALLTSLSLLRDHFPLTNNCNIESTLFNKKFCGYIDDFRDFQIAHYALDSERRCSQWGYSPNVTLPESLAYKIDIFKSTGLVISHEYEMIGEDTWLYLFCGNKIIPFSGDLYVESLEETEVTARLQSDFKSICSALELNRKALN